MNKIKPRTSQIYTHWGTFDVAVDGEAVTEVRPFEDDLEPSNIGQSLADGPNAAVRITQPMVRQGWLNGGPQSQDGEPAGNGGRGAEPFVPVSWDRAFELVASELTRVRETFGSQAIFGGSYGWASAGAFHRAPSQLQRFLGFGGGFTRSVNTYSAAAAETLIPHILGRPFYPLTNDLTVWPVIAKHTDLMVLFGGIPMKNTQVNSGGIGAHHSTEWLQHCKNNGVNFVNVSPLREDVDPLLEAEWLAIRPNADTALMLGLAHTLYVEGLHNAEFLAKYCVGFERFLPYLTGDSDGVAKDAVWAATITDISADDITALARRMADGRTMISLSWSIQRGDHGEQPYWMSAVLAAMLGQIGLPGGGIGYGYGAQSAYGNPVQKSPGPILPGSANRVSDFIPVARISDLLLKPGEPFDYNGKQRTYPDIRLVYWCGGNPFHHHQDLNRLVEAWQRPETVIVHDHWWTSVARHADIVLPAATALERNDIGKAANDSYIIASKQAMTPVGDARSDYEIFAGLAERLGIAAEYTEGRTEEEWLRHMWNVYRQGAARDRHELPDFDAFWEAGHVKLDVTDADRILFEEFRNDPANNPLKTPSGKIEIFSETIDGFGYDDCPGHPVWLEPIEWLGGEVAKTYPLHLISNQPKTKLHSQYDFGRVSLASKIDGREPMTVNPRDAQARGLEGGDIVRVFNTRGECFAGVTISDTTRPGVVILATGAWFDPEKPGGRDLHGNPNVLTVDKGTSKLSQAPIAHSALVEIEKWEGDLPPVRAFEAPEIVAK